MFSSNYDPYGDRLPGPRPVCLSRFRDVPLLCSLTDQEVNSWLKPRSRKARASLRSVLFGIVDPIAEALDYMARFPQSDELLASLQSMDG